MSLTLTPVPSLKDKVISFFFNLFSILNQTPALVLIPQSPLLCVFVFVCMQRLTCSCCAELVLFSSFLFLFSALCLLSLSLSLSTHLLTSRPSLSPMRKWVICPWQERKRKREQVLWVRHGISSWPAHVGGQQIFPQSWGSCSLWGGKKTNLLTNLLMHSSPFWVYLQSGCSFHPWSQWYQCSWPLHCFYSCKGTMLKTTWPWVKREFGLGSGFFMGVNLLL